MSSEDFDFGPADRLKGFEKPTVWQEFTPLAAQMQAVNLGQGFPDWPTPDFCKTAAVRAIEDNQNQYCRSAGLPDLASALATHYSPLFGRSLDPDTEVTVSVGVSEGLFAAIHSLVNPGDEVILIEPAFDIYAAQVKMAGGTCVYVPLRPPSPSSSTWSLDWGEVAAAFTPRTRLLLLNTPQNPTGKVFARSELQKLADLVRAHPRALVLSDEVYENLTYPGHEHVRLATLPGMWERTLTLSSAGKTFCVTGWKIGWLLGPTHLIRGVMCCNQYVQFSVATPLQAAVAEMLLQAQKPYMEFPSYYAWLRDEYMRKRTLLVDALRTAGLEPIVPEGGFFIIADTSNIQVPPRYLGESTPASPNPMSRDWAFCRYLTLEAGVAAIPPSAFYKEEHKHLAKNHARFAFCKADSSIVEAKARFLRWRGKDEAGVAGLENGNGKEEA
ncbi:hypothetical protein NSK_004602 [Nannochloropsis salina CCMP1776]|uniref:Aminotransferase class I/classII large domain-containing protein n=1 Tax=Nannochloropsis salina CCMP1776 TaxID=1027361 RepID=A0A4D9D6C1_9STRA|nr:hypothetical protein NSK_004602 [Nannochloropsis salina CCMP1776]|eukprot:TFJ84129.1 hypothetical protein NSK_004602 [Nannochloropsis salina CCMP1776]